jgi:hypothetical protein
VLKNSLLLLLQAMVVCRAPTWRVVITSLPDCLPLAEIHLPQESHQGLFCYICLKNSVPDPGSGAFLTSGSGIRDADADPDQRYENLFDPGSGMEKIRLRDKHPRSATLSEIWPLIFDFFTFVFNFSWIRIQIRFRPVPVPLRQKVAVPVPPQNNKYM